jgi:predicted nucleotidyltransferase
VIDVAPEQLALLERILDRYVPGIAVRVFGSRVTGRAKPHSDLDLALVAGAPLPWSTLAELEDALAESDLPFRVDLVEWARASETFRAAIDRRHEELKR